MPSRHADRLWIAGGLLGAVALLALGWFVFVGPQYAEAASLHSQEVQAQLRLTSQQRKLADLRRENEDLPQFKAQLERARAALPTSPATSDFLRGLQTASQEASVSVTGLTIGGRADVPGTAGAVYALPVALTVVGKVAGLEGFLTELQQVQSRAVLIRNANLTSDATGTSLTVNLQIFVAAGESAAAKPEK
jgi:Tfp pilus assembly protein PilO